MHFGHPLRRTLEAEDVRLELPVGEHLVALVVHDSANDRAVLFGLKQRDAPKRINHFKI